MPTYSYKREDGSTFELMQRITDDALETCPTTGQKVKRMIGGGAGLIFKGNGFYLTDYARKKTSASEPTTTTKTESKPVASETSKTESKSTSPPAKSD